MTIEDLKKKFAMLQEMHQNLREKRIQLESELKTLDADYQKKVKEFLKLTGTSSYEEAVEFCRSKKSELDKEMENLNTELTQFLNPELVVKTDDSN